MESAPSPDLKWVKASMSASLSACVELAPWKDMIALRDSKDPSVVLRLTPLEITAFIDGAKRGEFDHLIG